MFAFLGTGTMVAILKHVGRADWDREKLSQDTVMSVCVYLCVCLLVDLCPNVSSTVAELIYKSPGGSLQRVGLWMSDMVHKTVLCH
jgi:hypothetical protein